MIKLQHIHADFAFGQLKVYRRLFCWQFNRRFLSAFSPATFPQRFALFALTAGQISRVFLVTFGLFDGEELIFGIEQGNTRGCEFGSFGHQ